MLKLLILFASILLYACAEKEEIIVLQQEQQDIIAAGKGFSINWESYEPFISNDSRAPKVVALLVNHRGYMLEIDKNGARHNFKFEDFAPGENTPLLKEIFAGDDVTIMLGIYDENYLQEGEQKPFIALWASDVEVN